MIAGTLEVIVTSPKGRYVVGAQFHSASNESDMQLDAREFYRKHDGYGLGITAFPHYEIELVALPSVFTELRTQLHIHDSGQGKSFVCYPQQIKSLADAEEVLRVFCLGSVTAIEVEVDINSLLDEMDGDLARVREVVWERFQVACER